MVLLGCYFLACLAWWLGGKFAYAKGWERGRRRGYCEGWEARCVQLADIKRLEYVRGWRDGSDAALEDAARGTEPLPPPK